MNRRTFLKTVPTFTILAASGASSLGEDAGAASGATEEAGTASRPTHDLQLITLAEPQKDGGKSVLAALWQRRTIRNIRDEPLPPQMLSNLLWAAWGINREHGPSGRVGRTAASASNSQEIDLYVVLPAGIYLYEAAGHRLIPVVAGDRRAKVRRGRRRSGASAPVQLVYVADLARYSQGRPQEPGLRDPEVQKSYYNIATGLIAGNVYLFAASQGLAAWFHNCNKTGLAEELKLRSDQHVLYAQTVGYPAQS
ncbi:MAG TPA: nitroreductase family protein [Phycisphaerae bacterium]|nr:nitroreductase family protein [Phycisphaerae bacterium]